jgi:CO dehydrogenase maturation factor
VPEILAFAGKGGVGKTTLSGLLVRFLVELGKGPVLAVDADPNSNLNEVLGIPSYRTIGHAREKMKTDVPSGMTKESWMELKIHQALSEGKGFDLLVMGRPEGEGCYCAANTLVKKHIDFLKQNYHYVVVDNEAGMEHMSRLVTQDVNNLFVVSDATARGIMTAARILELIRELSLHIGKTHPVVNRAMPGREEELESLAREKGIGDIVIVHDDPSLFDFDARGENVFSLDGNSSALREAYRVFERIVGR